MFAFGKGSRGLPKIFTGESREHYCRNRHHRIGCTRLPRQNVSRIHIYTCTTVCPFMRSYFTNIRRGKRLASFQRYTLSGRAEEKGHVVGRNGNSVGRREADGESSMCVFGLKTVHAVEHSNTRCNSGCIIPSLDDFKRTGSARRTR